MFRNFAYNGTLKVSAPYSETHGGDDTLIAKNGVIQVIRNGDEKINISYRGNNAIMESGELWIDGIKVTADDPRIIPNNNTKDVKSTSSDEQKKLLQTESGKTNLLRQNPPGGPALDDDSSLAIDAKNSSNESIGTNEYKKINPFKFFDRSFQEEFINKYLQDAKLYDAKDMLDDNVPWKLARNFMEDLIGRLEHADFELVNLIYPKENPPWGNSHKELVKFIEKCEILMNEISKPEAWTFTKIQQYIAEIPRLKELISDPFYLEVTLHTLPHLYLKYKFTNAEVFEHLLLDEHYQILFNKKRDEFYSKSEFLDDWPFDDKTTPFWDFAMDLAVEMHEHNIKEVDQEKHKEIWDKYFKKSENENAWVTVAREMCPLIKTKTGGFRFVHDNLIDYLAVRKCHSMPIPIDFVTKFKS